MTDCDAYFLCLCGCPLRASLASTDEINAAWIRFYDCNAHSYYYYNSISGNEGRVGVGLTGRGMQCMEADADHVHWRLFARSPRVYHDQRPDVLGGFLCGRDGGE